MSEPTWTSEEAFDRAADLILDIIEEAFNIVPTDGRGRARAAIVAILNYYGTPKPGPATEER